MEIIHIDKLPSEANTISADDAAYAFRRLKALDVKSMLCTFSINSDLYLQAKPTKHIFRAGSMQSEFGNLFKSKPYLAEPWVHAAFIWFKNPFNKDECQARVVFYVWDTREVLHVEWVHTNYMRGDSIEYTAHVSGWKQALDNGAPVLTYTEQLKLF